MKGIYKVVLRLYKPRRRAERKETRSIIATVKPEYVGPGLNYDQCLGSLLSTVLCSTEDKSVKIIIYCGYRWCKRSVPTAFPVCAPAWEGLVF